MQEHPLSLQQPLFGGVPLGVVQHQCPINDRGHTKWRYRAFAILGQSWWHCFQRWSFLSSGLPLGTGMIIWGTSLCPSLRYMDFFISCSFWGNAPKWRLELENLHNPSFAVAGRTTVKIERWRPACFAASVLTTRTQRIALKSHKKARPRWNLKQKMVQI